MTDESTTRKRRPGLLAAWSGLPLYVRILIGLLAGIVCGLALGVRAQSFDLPARLILRVLGAVAPVLILLAVLRAIMTAEIPRGYALRLGGLLLLNTVVAICIGLPVANVAKPGSHADLPRPAAPSRVKVDVVTQLLDNIPDSFLRPFVENKVIGCVLIAVTFGVAARRLRGAERETTLTVLSAAFACVLTVLHWVIALVPFAVFGKVASILGTSGFSAFTALGWFVVSVLIALLLQAAYYLTRIRLSSWVRPGRAIAGLRDALIMAFSTASSTLTMPVTYEALRTRVGVRDRAASLGSLVGSNFNNDGTALYEAMAALFIAQLIDVQLSLPQQLMVVLTSVIASVGAAGIPEAGLVTMTLVFSAVHLPTEYIALLLTVDWFLDRCRTVINVLGDVNVACLLDGREAPPGDVPDEIRLGPPSEKPTS